MSSELIKTFDGLNVRIIDQDGEPWFVVTDIARAIGHNNPTLMMGLVDDPENKSMVSIGQVSGAKTTNIVNEDGLYDILLKARVEKAKPFRKWVREVIKEIHKTGSYGAPKPMTLVESIEYQLVLARQLEEKQNLIEHQASVISELDEQVSTYDDVLTALIAKPSHTQLNQVIKLLKLKQHDTYAKMEADGYLMKQGQKTHTRRPTQKAINEGFLLFSVDTTTGTYTTFATHSGVRYFGEKYRPKRSLGSSLFDFFTR